MEIKFYDKKLTIINTGAYTVEIYDIKNDISLPSGSQVGSVTIDINDTDLIEVTIGSNSYLLFDSYKLDECISKTEQDLFTSNSICDVIIGCKVDNDKYKTLTVLMCLKYSLEQHAEKNDIVGIKKVYNAMGCNLCSNEQTNNCGCKG